MILPVGTEHFENKRNVKFIETSNLDSYVKDYRQIGVFENEIPGSADSSSAEPEVNESVPAPGAKTILVVDDNEGMRNFLKILLQKQYRVIFAENGEEGIIRVREEKPDLVISDLMMPVMNGLEMTAQIKNDEKMKTTPVIMLTADTDLINKVSGLENGADDYLHKPFNTLELITRISSLLNNYEYQQIISRRNADIEREMEVARFLQNRLLPLSLPEIPGFHEHAIYIPMDKIGGDFYDIENRDGFLNLFIADVSGHGLPGAFLATITKMALENITDRTYSNRVLSLLNNVIMRYTVQSNFVTAFFATVDTGSRIMRYACAGHNPPVIYRKKNDELIELKTKGMPLGWFDNITIEEKTIQLEPGDRVVLYTDGIIECVNKEKEMFEEERFFEMIRTLSNKPAVEFSDKLMKELETFKGHKVFDDDITMVVLDVL
jgi:sigma-B regulation protein RsbU (phosphoserine phosphatase)